MSGAIDAAVWIGVNGFILWIIVKSIKSFGIRRSEKKQRVSGQADYDKSVQAWKTSRDE